MFTDASLTWPLKVTNTMTRRQQYREMHEKGTQCSEPLLTDDNKLDSPTVEADAFAVQSPLTKSQFKYLQQFAHDNLGLSIAEFKQSLVSNRIWKRSRALGLNTNKQYMELLKSEDHWKEHQPLINALTTNKTFFFREIEHFKHLKTTGLPDALKRSDEQSGRPVRIWSAGCSTGEEAWSIAMIARELLGNMAERKVRILATDINTEVLAHAQQGIYSQTSVETIPLSLRRRYMRKSATNFEGFKISDTLRRLVTFRKLNLNDPWPLCPAMDIIFCRNVTIYFDKPTRRKLYNRFCSVLEEQGLLYCGHSESLSGLSNQFKSISHSVNRRIP